MKKDDLLYGNGFELPRRAGPPTDSSGGVAPGTAGAECAETHAIAA
jgi:hypothetical protein